jgi:autophagy-related protein 27
VNLAIDRNSTITPIDIAGTYTSYNGRNIDAKFERLRDSPSNSDAGREGLRAILNGGRFPFDDKKSGVDQRAIIEFVCDKDRTGLEGDEKDNGDKEDDKDDDKEEDGDNKEEKLRRRDDSSKGKCEDSEASLRFCGFQLEDAGKDKKAKTLRLEWRTQYACEDAPPVDGGSHWGFFGWFFIV